ncbi:uncharacterized protein NPIL_364641, partial [Nephila pilipes]
MFVRKEELKIENPRKDIPFEQNTEEEVHLLESPYETNCTDYEGLWKKNNKTGPRSQEMCREMCSRSYYKPCADCEAGLTMVEKPMRMCRFDSCEWDDNDFQILKSCEKNCK